MILGETHSWEKTDRRLFLVVLTKEQTTYEKRPFLFISMCKCNENSSTMFLLSCCGHGKILFIELQSQKVGKPYALHPNGPWKCYTCLKYCLIIKLLDYYQVELRFVR